MAKLVLALLTTVIAWANPSDDRDWLYKIDAGGKTSYVWFVDFAPMDTTSFEVLSIERLLRDSCELLLDEAPTPALDDHAEFRPDQLSLAARSTLINLSLNHLPSGSLGDAWRTIKEKIESHLADRMEIYGDAMQNGEPLDGFGPGRIANEFHLASQMLWGTRFTNAALREGAVLWVRNQGQHWQEKYSRMRVWARDRASRAQVTDLHAGLTVSPSIERLDQILVDSAPLLMRDQTAAIYWNFYVSMHLRNELAARYFGSTFSNYQMVRAPLDEGDRVTGATLGDGLLLSHAPDFSAADDRIVAALRRGQAFVMVDAVRRRAVLDRLANEGVVVSPLRLRGFRPVTVK